ncbi:CRISPR-associated RAMP protein Csx7 [Carboxydocella sp. JDF658]|uniref:type III CRISPR-associated RAMP protein Csx7 n=1 Tax=Carboxydocella sp. JDF658 TaxID=1926600 RepID=UPI0009ABB7C8|nr:CRISPR-associated RAMP protein Csx7 [Carboxydocella sp. JDF658]GAW32180.1 CRISPR-associated RAMP protein [Carboxydocella sp. JDF658]
MLFDVFHNRIIIIGELLTVTPLHIGAGVNSLEVGVADNQVVKDYLGRPYIPGSSLKGVLRAFTESIVRALAETGIKGGELWACDVLDKKHNCVHDVKKSSDEEEIYNRHCSVCKVFGSTQLAGKFQVKDLTVTEDGWDNWYESRNGVSIDRDSGTAAIGLLYESEVVPADTLFELEIVLENLSPRDKFIAAIGLKALLQGELTLGGMTSRGLGRVRLIKARVKKVNQHNLVDYLAGKEIPELELARVLEQWLQEVLD